MYNFTYTVKYALQIIYYDIMCVCVIYSMTSRIMHAPKDWSFKHEKNHQGIVSLVMERTVFGFSTAAALLPCACPCSNHAPWLLHAYHATVCHGTRRLVP